MTCIMVGSIVLFMASIASASAAPAMAVSGPSFRPSTSATSRSTVTIRVISGVRFGSDHVEGDSLASRRKARLTDAAGQLRDAELLEFQ
jgi:hypothetical protein